jgi:hypothetical protein
MTVPKIHGSHRSVPASKLLKALADALTQIKDEDDLTDADLGAELGKHGDTAAKYRAGLADMPGTVLLRGILRWDGRFINGALALLGFKLVALDPAHGSDRAAFTALTGLLHQFAEALEDDGVIDDDELEAMRPSVEKVGRHVDRLRERLRAPTPLKAVG